MELERVSTPAQINLLRFGYLRKWVDPLCVHATSKPQPLNGAAIVGLIVFVFVLFYVLYWPRIL